ncbi:hypothetical protein GC102_24765 [Paenibacillus sp. LMG 31460]|uniref:Uncharacterized protein n=1 Tax=Paenibacillus germinis TaxID=2654979 RepID=A0ABX1Z7V1_9BACL|nr:hypothetical protein [Paenibacillus germinis]
MSWIFFSCITLAASLIFWLEWRNLKQKTKKDRLAFVMLLLIVWLLSMLDLPNTPGPTTFLEFIFKPLKGLVEQ